MTRISGPERSNPYCDGDNCKNTQGTVRLIPLWDGKVNILCRDCYVHVARRYNLLYKLHPLPKWEETLIYPIQ